MDFEDDFDLNTIINEPKKNEFQIFDDSQNHSLSDIQELNSVYLSKNYSKNGDSNDSFNDKKDFSQSTSVKSEDQKQTKKTPLSIEEKKARKREVNKFAARRTRQRKKEEIIKLVQENSILKRKIENLESKLDQLQCPYCLKHFQFSQSENCHPEKPGTYLSHGSSGSKKLFVLLTSAIALLCLLFTCTERKEGRLRNLFSGDLSKDFIERYKILGETVEFTKEEIKSFNFSISDWLVSIGDYYSISQGKEFLNEEKYRFSNKGKIRLVKEKEANKYINSSCHNCLVELNKTNMHFDKKNPFLFSIFLPVNDFWKTSYDGFIEFSSEGTQNVLEVNCLIIGAAAHSTQKINANISN